ncbi:NAD(+)--rifampin ADP-ribosyltransferase [Reichenbachiella carrageenanivorans]|uniref:NAD(+)--rifampin ADP-ribosyltransferase n=1 Tax=Reichenbachiella carrageenanivorans TaxID=2979869 RepID=A0ABY6CY81_9BACT|nr:NAD(+)--rifampin ADP-ribosyltransferase [Reichenbachiella carrageenanivorans]UXX78684.1 NAD(+)--rifampin ADP-ribosyltransferase [Reichenbachiella carrageenanivorans]
MTNNSSQAIPTVHTPFIQTYLHGTKADLKLGELLEVGYNSNFGKQNKAKYLYLTATLDPAVWGAELALGEMRERIYLVEPTGPIEDDPNLTNQKFPGNPSMSYRTQHPLKVVGEVTIWQSHSADQLKEMKDAIAKLDAQGIRAIE